MNPTQNPTALRSKNIIIDTLLNLMKDFNYSEITVKHILLESRLSRKTFYRNFSSKDDVLNSYIEIILKKYLAALSENDCYNFIKILDIVFVFCERYKDFFVLLNKNDLMHLLLKSFNNLIIQNHYQFKSFNNDFNDKDLGTYIIFFNIGGIWNIIFHWIKDGMEIPASDIKETIINYLTKIQNIDLRTI